MITISTGSTVSMKSFNVGSSGGVGCELIVNGTLTAETDDTAIITGKLKIGSSGVLNVGCETGAIIKGMTNENDVPLFIFNDGAKFTGNAEDCNIMVGPVSPTKEANDLFSLSANCIPDGYIIKKIVYNEYNAYFTITQDSQTPTVESESVKGAGGLLKLGRAKPSFVKPVEWAVLNDITSGTDKTHFSPYMSCTRAQIVTLLYRQLGK